MREHFNTYLEKEIKKYNGIAFPVKSSVWERAFVTRVNCLDLHPNPDDEFTKPGVGPSYRIISEYEQKIRTLSHDNGTNPLNDAIIVEKMHPEGYMIVNGHHRWAAFYRVGWKKVGLCCSHRGRALSDGDWKTESAHCCSRKSCQKG